MFTKQFKILIGVIVAIFALALNFFSQYMTQTQIKQLQTELDRAQLAKTIIVTPTVVPTATPSAAIKKVLLPTWTPTPSK